MVYNALGQKVKTLINSEVYNHGSHQVTWDATNEAGNRVATGMYIYSLKFLSGDTAGNAFSFDASKNASKSAAETL